MSTRRNVLPRRAVALVSAPATAAPPPDPAPQLLRLPDLGPGYVVQELGFSAVRRACAQFRFPLRGAPRTLNELGRRAANRGCTLWFSREWTPPGAPPGAEQVMSTAFAFDGPGGAQAALARARALAAVIIDAPPRYLPPATPAPRIGDEAVRLRVASRWRGRRHVMAFVVWRSGPVVGMVATSDSGPREHAAETAHRLATVQQARIAAPTPLRPPVNDDRLVLLDDPGLAVPVMWLGERFPGHGRFPPLHLRGTNDTWHNGRVPEVRLVYETRRLPEAVTIELWKPQDTGRLLHARLYDYQCQRRFNGGLDGVRSTIFAVYLREHGRCPRRGAFLDAAYARFDDVFVRIDATGCCRSVVPPYDSLAGLRTLLRSLRPRSVPVP